MSIQIIVTPEETVLFYQDGQRLGELKPTDSSALVELLSKGGAEVHDTRPPAEPLTVL